MHDWLTEIAGYWVHAFRNSGERVDTNTCGVLTRVMHGQRACTRLGGWRARELADHRRPADRSGEAGGGEGSTGARAPSALVQPSHVTRGPGGADFRRYGEHPK